ncbi:MAG: GxxExxY protein [Verrucomicrobiales bacterium]|nr:GxxExxY protein [Verrucomicrobiales bacterium]
MLELDSITGIIVNSAVKIHRDLGPGLMESVYELVLARDLDKCGLQVERQKLVQFEYDGLIIHDGFKVDLLVESRVPLELKSLETLAPVHFKQILTYLRLLKQPVGLLMNFGAVTMKEGLHRVVNKLAACDSPTLRVNQQPER